MRPTAQAQASYTMSQGKKATEILADPSFGRNLKRWVQRQQIKRALRGNNFIRSPAQVEKQLMDMLLRRPDVFSSYTSSGKTRKQIARELYNQFTRYV